MMGLGTLLRTIVPTTYERIRARKKSQVNAKITKVSRTSDGLQSDDDIEKGSSLRNANMSSGSKQWHFEYTYSNLEPFADAFRRLCPPHFRGSQEHIHLWYTEVSLSLQRHVSKPSAFTLLSAVSHLEESGLLLMGTDERYRHLQTYLVFCMIGVLSCLYHPTTDGLVRPLYTIEEVDTKILHRYSCVYNGRIKALEARRQVPNILKGFGQLLPTTDAVGRTRLEHPRPLYPNQINAHVLLGVVKVKLQWTDILGAHLDFEDRTKTLYVFKLPSFCLMHATTQDDDENNVEVEVKRSILCASITNEDDDENLINDLMAEIVLSLYVIFGQDPRARKLCQQSKVLCEELQTSNDAVLQSLCQGYWPSQEIGRQPKEVYHLPSDFPLTGAKLEYLRQIVLEQEPQGIMQLWVDKRNSLQWYTFWAVVIIGGVGLLLEVIQTVLSAMQVYYAAPTKQLD